MKNRRNYYRVLHVGPDAPTAVIQASYRALMQRLKMHPDLGGDHDQAALVNEAYAVLSDPGKRRAYDRTLAHASAQRRADEAASPRHPSAAPAASTASAAKASAKPQSPPKPPSPACPFCAAPYRPNDDHPDRVCTTCGSALAPAPKHHLSEMSRRHIERLPRHFQVTFHLSPSRDTTWSGTTEDLSLSGMRLLTDARVPVGERLKIECSFCSAVAVVRSAQREHGAGRGWAYGVEFITLRLKRQRGGLVSTVA